MQELLSQEKSIYLQIKEMRKYSRIIEMFARSANIPLEQALDFFYHSELYQEMSEGISDMHCRSDHYLVEEMETEWKEQ